MVRLRGRERHTFLRQLTDHSTFLPPVNALVDLFSAVPSRPYLAGSGFPALSPLSEHWRELRGEALALQGEARIGASTTYDHPGRVHLLGKRLKAWRNPHLLRGEVRAPGRAGLAGIRPSSSPKRMYH